MNMLLFCIFVTVLFSTSPVQDNSNRRALMTDQELAEFLASVHPFLVSLFFDLPDAKQELNERLKKCTPTETVVCTGIFIAIAKPCYDLALATTAMAGLPECLAASLTGVPTCYPCAKKVFSDRRFLQVEETEDETQDYVVAHLAKNTQLLLSNAEERMEICFKDCIVSFDQPELVDSEKMCLSNCGVRHVRAMVAMTRVELEWALKYTSEAKDMAESVLAPKEPKKSGRGRRLLSSKSTETSSRGNFFLQMLRKLEIASMDICAEKGLQHAHYDSTISGCELQKIENCRKKFNEASIVVDSGVGNWIFKEL